MSVEEPDHPAAEAMGPRRMPQLVEHCTIRGGVIHGADMDHKDTQAVNDLVANG